jgi:hypothetical protein
MVNCRVLYAPVLGPALDWPMALNTMRGAKRVVPSCSIARTSSTGDLLWSKCWIGSGACRCLFAAAVLCWVRYSTCTWCREHVRTAACCRLQHGRSLGWGDDPCSLAFARLLLGRQNLFFARDREHFCSGNFVHCVSRDRFGTNVEKQAGLFCSVHVTPCRRHQWSLNFREQRPRSRKGEARFQ